MSLKSPRKILVTGGGGFLGYAISKLLSERGDSITSFSRRFYPELEPFNAEQIRGDISDKALTEHIKGIFVVKSKYKKDSATAGHIEMSSLGG